MTAPLAEVAPVKVNLALHVTGRRPDGLHLLDSLVVFARLGDLVEARAAPALSLVIDGPFAGDLGAGPDNLVLRAARLLDPGRGAALRLTKSIPVASGIGGGSADAAATAAPPLPPVGPAAPGAEGRPRPRRRPARLPRRPSLPHVRRRRDAGAPRDAPLLDGARQPRGRRPDRGGLRRPRLARRLASLRAAGLLHPGAFSSTGWRLSGTISRRRRSPSRPPSRTCSRPSPASRTAGPRGCRGPAPPASASSRPSRPPAPPPPPSAAPSPPGGSPPLPSIPIEDWQATRPRHEAPARVVPPSCGANGQGNAGFSFDFR